MKTPAWLETLDQRMAHRTDRASLVLYILTVGPVLTILWLLQWAPALDSGAAQAFDARWWPVLQACHGALLLWMVLWAAWLWPRRLDPAPDALAVQAVLLPSMLGLVILALGMGIKDTPMGMFLLITFVVGRGLFSLAQMRVGLWVCLALMLAHEAAQVLDLLPYAFLLHRPVYVGEPLTPWWNLWLRLTALLALVPLSGVLFLLALLVQRRQRALKSLVLSDALTGLANRRAFMSQLEREAHRQERHDRPLSILIIDIDHFKQVNDRWGHAVGDEVLRQVGQLLRQHTREQVDMVARYGGEEFVVLLPDTNLEGAQAVAEKLAVRIRQHEFVAKRQPFHVSMSLGVVQYTGGDPDQALRAADRNLYAAKARGRDCIVASMAPKAA